MSNTVETKGKKIGETFELIGIKWKVLDITDKGYVCMASEPFGKDRTFDMDSNDYKESQLRKYLNEDLYLNIAAEIGEENIIEFERDLTAVDGRKDYGSCTDKVSVVTFDEYRKYREHIPNPGTWLWTITPWSTKENGWKYPVAVVAPSGDFSCNDYSINIGVCPFCIFSSSIF